MPPGAGSAAPCALVRDRTGDRDPLLLATRQLRRHAVHLVHQADLVQRVHGTVAGTADVHLRQLQRQQHVLQGRQVGQELVALEDAAQPAPEARDVARPELPEVHAVHHGHAGPGLQAAVQEPQQCRLAGTGRSLDADELARIDVQRDVGQDRLALVSGRDVRQPDGSAAVAGVRAQGGSLHRVHALDAVGHNHVSTAYWSSGRARPERRPRLATCPPSRESRAACPAGD